MQNYNLNLFSKFRGELMGIAILGVSFLHACVWADINIEDSILGRFFTFFAKIAYTEGFLFLSGFGLYYSFYKDKHLREFYIKRFNRVLLPYVLMSIPFLMLGFLYGDITMSKIILKVLTLYFWFYGNDGMWYISISAVLYFLFPYVYKFVFLQKEEKFVSRRILFLIIVYVVLLFILYKCSPNYYKLIEIGVTKGPIFFIGIFVGYLSYKGKKYNLKHIAFLGGVLGITFMLKKQNVIFSPLYWIIYRLIMMASVCIIFSKMPKTTYLFDVLKWFGKYSLEIYIMQILLIGTIKNIMILSGFDNIYILQTLLTFSIVLAFCVPIHKCVLVLEKYIRL